jgi:hypothetical protein
MHSSISWLNDFARLSAPRASKIVSATACAIGNIAIELLFIYWLRNFFTMFRSKDCFEKFSAMGYVFL